MNLVVSHVLLAPVWLVVDFLILIMPDYHPGLDLVFNIVSIVPGKNLIRLYNLLIVLAVTSLFFTPRQLQLPNWRYETLRLDSAYDYIVVGGGTTGAMMANRLVSNSKGKVLLIEAGGANNYVNLFPLINSLNVNDDHYNMNWHLRTVPQRSSHIFTGGQSNKGSYEGGGKGLGGTSQINWQIYSRGFCEDYDRYESYFGAEGWNCTSMIAAMKKSAYQNGYENFRPSAKLHSLRPTPGVEQISVSIGSNSHIKQIISAFEAGGKFVTGLPAIYDHNSNRLGFGRMQFAVQENGYTGHAGRRFIYPLRKHLRDSRNSRLHIMLNAEAKKIEFTKTSNGLRASRVLVTKGGKSQAFDVLKEVIVTAGFYGTPTLLLRSGIGPQEELQENKITPSVILEGVGQNLHNHQSALGFPIVFPKGKNFSDISLKQIVKAFTKGTGRFRMQNSVTAVGFDIATDDDVTWNQNRPNIEYILYAVTIGNDNGKRVFVNSYGLREDVYKEFYAGMYGGTRLRPRESMFATATLLHPKVRGNVTLHRNRFNIDYQYQSDRRDVDTLVLGHAKLARILYAAFMPLGGLLPNKPIRDCESEWRDWVGDQDPNPMVYEPYRQCVLQGGRASNIARTTTPRESCLKQSITRAEKRYLECFVRHVTSSAFHMGGTARLGDCDANDGAVVDKRCRVCGLSNLRASDASLLPETVSGHNIATLYGITQRCSEMILDDNNA